MFEDNCFYPEKEKYPNSDSADKDAILPSDTIPIDLTATKTRFYMLFLACFLCIGSYYVYDTPAALEPELEDVIFYLVFRNWSSKI